MHRKLLDEAFKKAEEEIGSDKVTPRAQLLSDFIFEDSKEPYGERILRDYYRKIKEDSDDKINLKAHVVESLSRYLGYIDFADYVKTNAPSYENKTLTFKSLFKTYKLVIIISIILISGIFIVNSVTKQRWMVWQIDHYEEVDFDAEKYKVNQLKIFKEERIDFFKKVTPPCDYSFFNKDGSIKIWYGKNKRKELEYFTALGLHPETGKTLKPITQYMIDKYICNKQPL